MQCELVRHVSIMVTITTAAKISSADVTEEDQISNGLPKRRASLKLAVASLRLAKASHDVRYEIGTFIAVAGTGLVDKVFLGEVVGEDVLFCDESVDVHWYNKLDVIDDGFSVFEKASDHHDVIPLSCVIARAVDVFHVTIDWEAGCEEKNSSGRFYSWVGESKAVESRKAGMRLGVTDAVCGTPHFTTNPRFH